MIMKSQTAPIGWYMTVQAICAAFLLLGLGHAAAAPLDVSTPWRGVQIHKPEWDDRSLNAVRDLGFNFVRTGFYWHETELTPGKYDWHVYDELVNKLRARNLKVLFTLYGYNRRYDRTHTFTDPAAIDAFAAWSAAAARHFNDPAIVWEIWNEPNLPGSWAPKPDALTYARLALTSCVAIHRANPRATVLGGALSANPKSIEKTLRFAQVMMSHGLDGCMDGYTIHPYRDTAPETVAETYKQFRAVVPTMSPVFSGEWGYSTTGSVPMTESTQAAYAVREFLSNEANGVRLNLWYNLIDKEDHAKARERGFGLLTSSYRVKPSGQALSSFNKILHGYELSHKCPSQSSDKTIFLYQKIGAKNIIVSFNGSLVPTYQAVSRNSRAPCKVKSVTSK